MNGRRENLGGNRPSLDLHGVHPDRVDAKLEQFFHAAQREGRPQVEVVTGRGASNRSGQPVLRKRVEKWLEQNKQRFGVMQKQVTGKGGALLVDLSKRS